MTQNGSPKTFWWGSVVAVAGLLTAAGTAALVIGVAELREPLAIAIVGGLITSLAAWLAATKFSNPQPTDLYLAPWSDSPGEDLWPTATQFYLNKTTTIARSASADISIPDIPATQDISRRLAVRLTAR